MPRDLSGRWKAALLLWGLPVAALLAVGGETGWPKTAVWTVALVWMGLGCLWNARRCGRRHCYLTGPWFLVLAVTAALHGTGVLPLGDDGWLWLGVALVPEWIRGRYVGDAAP